MPVADSAGNREVWQWQVPFLPQIAAVWWMRLPILPEIELARRRQYNIGQLPFVPEIENAVFGWEGA